jgi:hypothetical protein
MHKKLNFDLNCLNNFWKIFFVKKHAGLDLYNHQLSNPL